MSAGGELGLLIVPAELSWAMSAAYPEPLIWPACPGTRRCTLPERADLHPSAKSSQRLPCFLLRPASTGITLSTPSVHTISATYSSSLAPEHSSSPQPCRPGGCNPVGAGPCQRPRRGCPHCAGQYRGPSRPSGSEGKLLDLFDPLGGHSGHPGEAGAASCQDRPVRPTVCEGIGSLVLVKYGGCKCHTACVTRLPVTKTPLGYLCTLNRAALHQCEVLNKHAVPVMTVAYSRDPVGQGKLMAPGYHTDEI